VLAVAGCAGDEPAISMLALPAGAQSGAPWLAVDGDTVVLSWLEQPETDRAALRYARWSGGGWEAPVPVEPASDDPHLADVWSDPPQLWIGPRDAGWLAAWSRAGRGNAIERVIARSEDGRHWQDGIRLGGGGDGRQRGWAAAIPGPQGSLGLAWLETGSAGTRLRYQEWTAAGPGTALTVDGSACPWCSVSGVRFRGRTLLGYRDRSDTGVRDPVLRALDDEGWSEARALHADGWRLGSCPVSGPALAVAGDRLVAAWFTAADDDPRVLVAGSHDGTSFGDPLRVDGGAPLGRLALAGWDDGSCHVAWFERVGREAELRVVRVDSSGTSDAAGVPLVLGRTETGTAAGVPRMARAADRVYVAWTVPGPPSSVRIAAIRP
jgi:hypothetical protein